MVPAAAAVTDPAWRIWLIGDSQTFGFGLSDADTWPNRLQEILLERGYRDTKVLNLGVPGIMSTSISPASDISHRSLRPATWCWRG